MEVSSVAYQQIAADDCAGKVVHGVVYGFDGEMLVAFTDETFAAFHIKRYHDGDADIEEMDAADLLDFPSSDLDDLGILSESERGDMFIQRQREFESAQKAMEWDLFLRLKRKYESGSGSAVGASS